MALFQGRGCDKLVGGERRTSKNKRPLHLKGRGGDSASKALSRPEVCLLGHQLPAHLDAAAPFPAGWRRGGGPRCARTSSCARVRARERVCPCVSACVPASTRAHGCRWSRGSGTGEWGWGPRKESISAGLLAPHCGLITNQLERAEGDGGRVTAPARRLRVGGSGFQPVSATLRDLCIHILGEGYYHYCIVCLCLRGTRAGERCALSSRASRI